MENRNSFSLQFRQCNRDVNPNCESDETVKKFLENVYFKMNIVESRVDFG